jgi:hypothetical protein
MIRILRGISYDRACTIIVNSAIVSSIFTFLIDEFPDERRDSLKFSYHLESAFDSKEFQYSIIGSICAAVPVLLELFWDVSLLVSPENKRDRRFWLYRLTVLTSLLVPDAIALHMTEKDNAFGGTYISLVTMQRVVAVSVVLLMLIEYVQEDESWDVAAFVFLEFSFNLSQLLWLVTTGQVQGSTTAVVLSSSIITDVTLVGLLLLFAKRLYFLLIDHKQLTWWGFCGDLWRYLIHDAKASRKKVKQNNPSATTRGDFPMFALLLTIGLILVNYLFEKVTTHGWGWSNVTGPRLSFHVFVFTIYSLLIVVTCARNTRREAVNNKVNFIANDVLLWSAYY